MGGGGEEGDVFGYETRARVSASLIIYDYDEMRQPRLKKMSGQPSETMARTMFASVSGATCAVAAAVTEKFTMLRQVATTTDGGRERTERTDANGRERTDGVGDERPGRNGGDETQLLVRQSHPHRAPGLIKLISPYNLSFVSSHGGCVKEAKINSTL